MAGKSSAPRRKAAPDAAPASARELRGTKLSCSRRVCNRGKWDAVAPLFDRACALKGRMSTHVSARGMAMLLAPYALKAEYKLFPSPDLNAWERQAMFHDIVGDYQRSLAQRLAGAPFRLQRAWRYLTYSKDVTRKQPNGTVLVLHREGAVKAGSFQLETRTSALTRCANYLLRVDTALFEPSSMAEKHALRPEMLRLQAKPALWARLLVLVEQRQRRIVAQVKCITYVTGSFRVSPEESKSRIVVDKDNGQYQLFLKLRLGLGADKSFVHLPLLANPARLKDIAQGDVMALGFGKEFRLKLTAGRKIHVCTTYEAETPVFMPEERTMGLDLNTKRAFADDCAGRAYQLDALVLAAGLALLSRIDREGGVSKMGYRRAAQLRQWLRRNEASIKQLLAGWFDEWKATGVTDLWLEDLSMSHDATFIRHHALDEKYSRVTRLMRLSGVKDWLLSLGEKRGIRVHTTDPAYTSQECPECHHTARANRPSQAVFHCEVCHFEGDADQVAARNIKNRGNPELRGLLHVEDKFGRCSPRAMKRSALKAAVMAQALRATASAGGVSDLPTPASTTKAGPGLPQPGSSGSSIHAP